MAEHGTDAGGPPSTRPRRRAADWWTLLHPPYTVWHLAYVVLGATLAPRSTWFALARPGCVLPRRRRRRSRLRRAPRPAARDRDRSPHAVPSRWSRWSGPGRSASTASGSTRPRRTGCSPRRRPGRRGPRGRLQPGLRWPAGTPTSASPGVGGFRFGGPVHRPVPHFKTRADRGLVGRRRRRGAGRGRHRGRAARAQHQRPRAATAHGRRVREHPAPRRPGRAHRPADAPGCARTRPARDVLGGAVAGRRGVAGPRMRAVRYDAYGATPGVVDVPAPACPPDGVVVRVRATGVCRSDWHAWQGHDPVPLPQVPGHELPPASSSRWARRSAPTRSARGSPCRSSAVAAGAPGAPPATHRRAHEYQPGFTGPGSFAVHGADPKRRCEADRHSARLRRSPPRSAGGARPWGRGSPPRRCWGGSRSAGAGAPLALPESPT